MTNAMTPDALTKRDEFELIASAAGWVCDPHPESTDFSLSGWRIGVRWMESGEYPASFAVYDPDGQLARAMSFLADGWTVGGELLMQLKSPGPQRELSPPLPVLIAGYAQLLEMLDDDRKLPVHAVAQRLRGFLEDVGA